MGENLLLRPSSAHSPVLRRASSALPPWVGASTALRPYAASWAFQAAAPSCPRRSRPTSVPLAGVLTQEVPFLTWKLCFDSTRAKVGKIIDRTSPPPMTNTHGQGRTSVGQLPPTPARSPLIFPFSSFACRTDIMKSFGPETMRPQTPRTHRTGGRRFLVRISSELKVLKVLKVLTFLHTVQASTVRRVRVVGEFAYGFCFFRAHCASEELGIEFVLERLRALRHVLVDPDCCFDPTATSTTRG